MTKNTFSDLSEALASAVSQTSQSVVTVLSGRPISGVVTADNEILTVAHVLPGDEVQVRTPDGRELTAQVVGRQHASDLALLRVADLNMPPVTASQGAQVGELLSVVARPERGVQAALGFLGAALPERGFMPTGATPFRGVSGGGVFDARGGLIGLANAGLSRGELLAVPAERALRVAGLLSRDGRVPQGYLGIGTQPVHFPEQAQPEQVQPGQTPPEAGQPTAGAGGAASGRGERGRNREGRGGPWGREGAGREGPGREAWGRGGRGGWNGRGWSERGWDGRGGPGGGPRRGKIGLTVVQVEPASPAQLAGIMLGDVVLTLGGLPIHHPVQLLDAVRDRAGETLTLGLLRGGSQQDVSVTLGER
ncbi:S1C family serine protease [Deinococcus alpinitundrae]|uniref:S1C family serine protease n=1 Tax=Deinococcus alpinitundrae TaxID=468913 RepID=UPI00137A35E6|nr:S1C family serine protease [Deinococcus alpinitundrae]